MSRRAPSAWTRFLSLAFLCLASNSVWANGADGPASSGPESPRVASVFPTEAGLGFKRAIKIHVEGLPAPVDAADAAKKGAEYQGWVLYLDGCPISRLHPTSVDAFQSDFYFEMKRSKESAEAWRLLFKQVSFWPFSRATRITVGPEIGGSPVTPLLAEQTAAGAFNLVVVPLRRCVMLALAYAVLAVIIFQLARRSNILRAPLAPGVDLPTRERPFSLGRAQMAAWFMVVLAAFLFLGLITDDWTQSLNVSTLGLMGVAAATALGAQAIDSKKEERTAAAGPQVQALQAQAGTLNEAIKGAAADAVSSISTELSRVNERLSLVQSSMSASGRHLKPASRSFLKDLVSDESGVGLHRVQIVVWTITLCGAFLYLVGRDLAMPTFDPTLLALMGISSGTYLGFKFPER